MKDIRFVDVGEGITEGHIQKWLVKDGESVKEDQSIVQVETDKAVVNVPAPTSGVVKVVAQENTTVHVGDMIAMVGTADEINNYKSGFSQTQVGNLVSHSDAAIPPSMLTAANAQKQETATATADVITTPFVRKLARDLGVDINKITGTGPGGRILENDIRSDSRQAVKQQAPVPKFSELLEEKHDQEIERVPMTQLRKAIAKNMELSWTIPRAVHMDLINATHLYNIVKAEKANAEQKGVKLTFLSFIIKATIEGLKDNPRFNSSYDHEKQEIILKKYYNIGLAVQGDDGLRVAVIKNADKKSILEIAKEIQELHDKVVNKTISVEEMKDSTFTITNIGSLKGGYLSVPMINYPEVAILGIHLIREVPVVENGQIVIGRQLPFSLSFDHRVVDGADAVLFGNTLIKYMEDPEFLEML